MLPRELFANGPLLITLVASGVVPGRDGEPVAQQIPVTLALREDGSVALFPRHHSVDLHPVGLDADAKASAIGEALVYMFARVGVEHVRSFSAVALEA